MLIVKLCLHQFGPNLSLIEIFVASIGDVAHFLGLKCSGLTMKVILYGKPAALMAVSMLQC